MKNIAIVGAGGFGREVKTIIDALNRIQPIYNLVGFYDDGVEQNTMINGFPVLGGIADLQKVSEELLVVVAVGTPLIKRKIIESISNVHISYPNLIHPTVIIGDDTVKFGIGSIICASCVLTCNISIQDFVILNLMCTVGHDTHIQNFASLMPSVNISGEVEIGQSVYIGTGAKLINQLSIGDHTVIGAGAVVSKSLPANCTAVGIPAKPIKFHES